MRSGGDGDLARRAAARTPRAKVRPSTRLLTPRDGGGLIGQALGCAAVTDLPGRQSAYQPTVAIVVAGGVGRRMGGGAPKQFRPLAGKPMLLHSLEVFDRHPGIDAVCVVADVTHHGALRAEAPWTGLSKPLVLAAAGPERADSVRSGLEAVRGRARWVVVHDAARPLVTGRMIDDVLAVARRTEAAIVARAVAETVKRVGEDGLIIETLDRRRVWLAETPQAFGWDLLARALEEARRRAVAVTDDAQAVELLGLPVAIVAAATPNPKVTVPADWALAEWLLRARAGEAAG